MIDLTNSILSSKNAGMKIKGVIFDIKRYAIHDGPGIRTTVFLKGCPLTCWWCHNPESQKMEPEVVNKKLMRDLSSSMRQETVGREVTVAEVIADIEKDLLFYDESGGGVTFSGGEPLMQLVFLNSLLSACQELEITTALDTCGYASRDAFQTVIDKVNLFLYDIKLLDDDEHLKYTGVSNEPILSNLRLLDAEKRDTIIRFPVIPGITDTDANIKQLIEFLSTLENVKEIDLLPYHKIGKGKFEKLNRIYELSDLDPPSTERLNQLVERFHNTRFKVKIGG
ncbi:MAG: glycyl-radical enzyme activating protein [Candidatus Odinarchaeota archaeon]